MNSVRVSIMASTEDPLFILRLFADKERNRVVMAEASGDFIDTLFSFLTLPLGTIIRLISKDQKPLEIGCINNIYQSVKDCDTQVFWNEICKQMLLYPRNPCEELCQKLRLNVDDTKPSKLWMCGHVNYGCVNSYLSTFAGASCQCGEVMNKEMKLHGEDSPKKNDPVDGAFVKRNVTYLIFDDLKVLPSSPANSVQQLIQLGYTDFNSLTEMSLHVDSKKILDLLKRALISKSPLSDILFDVKDEGPKSVGSFTPFPASTGAYYRGYPIDLKIIVSRSKNKIMYAEAEADFLDFLFSFLTIPIGSILYHLIDNVSLGCMDTLYKSVKGLNSSYFTGLSSYLSWDLRVAPQHSFTKQPLAIGEKETPSYYYGYVNMNGVISKNKELIREPRYMKLFDPRCADGRREAAVGFVRRPSVFAVMDDLQVMPLTSASSISFLQKLNVPLDDLEEHRVSIRDREARNLLGASLTSKAALTNGLLHLLKKPEEEPTS